MRTDEAARGGESNGLLLMNELMIVGNTSAGWGGGVKPFVNGISAKPL